MSAIGKFPNRLKPITKRPDITKLDLVMDVKALYEKLSLLSMSVYTPFDYIFDSKRRLYEERYDTEVSASTTLKQSTREQSLQNLMRVLLLKRLESSVEAFRLTLSKVIDKIKFTIDAIDRFEESGGTRDMEFFNPENIDQDDSSDRIDEENSIGDKVKINLEDMNILGWKEDLQRDLGLLESIYSEMLVITPEHDNKLQVLKNLIKSKVENPINPGNRKILIFSAFADTVDYLYQELAPFNTSLGLHTAKLL